MFGLDLLSILAVWGWGVVRVFGVTQVPRT
jgi:hypothetical protein